MDRIKELIAVLSDNKVQERTFASKDTQTCKICGEPADEFLNASSKFEFIVSAICQSCQDYYFPPDH